MEAAGGGPKAAAFATLRRRYLCAINNGAEAQCRLDEVRKENADMHVELGRALGEARRLCKSNCELKYANKRLAQLLHKQRASEHAGQQLLRETVTDVRRRFGKVEAAVAHRTADTMQITQHLRRLADCVALSCPPTPPPPASAAASRGGGGGCAVGGSSGAGTGPSGTIDVSTAKGLRTVSDAMHRALQQLERLYGGPNLFGTIFGKVKARERGGRRRAGGAADDGDGSRANSSGRGSVASSSGGSVDGSSTAATSASSSTAANGRGCRAHGSEADVVHDVSSSSGEDDDIDSDGGGRSSSGSGRRAWELGLENRQLREEVLQLQWELKRARAARPPQGAMLCLGGSESGGVCDQDGLVECRAEIRALRMRLEEVLRSQSRLREDVAGHVAISSRGDNGSVHAADLVEHRTGGAGAGGGAAARRRAGDDCQDDRRLSSQHWRPTQQRRPPREQFSRQERQERQQQQQQQQQPPPPRQQQQPVWAESPVGAADVSPMTSSYSSLSPAGSVLVADPSSSTDAPGAEAAAAATPYLPPASSDFPRAGAAAGDASSSGGGSASSFDLAADAARTAQIQRNLQVVDGEIEDLQRSLQRAMHYLD